MNRLLPLSCLLVLMFGASGSCQTTSLYHIEIQHRHGFIDEAGRVVIPLKFEAALDFSYGLAAVRVNHLWGFIDTTGQFVIPPRFQGAGYFSNAGVASVELNDYWGFIDRTGKVVVSPRFGEIDCSETSFPLIEDHQYFDAKENFFLRYSDLDGYGNCFSNGLARYKERDGLLWGYINENDELAISMQFEFAYGFSDGLAAVSPPGSRKWGYIDTKGKIVIPIQFDAVSPFYDGLALVNIDGKSGFIRTDGTFSLPPTIPSEGLIGMPLGRSRFALMNDRGNSAIFDDHGVRRTDYVFATVEPFNGPVAAVTMHDDFFTTRYIDVNGHLVQFSNMLAIPPQ